MAVPYECARKRSYGGTQTWHLDTKAKSLTDARESAPEMFKSLGSASQTLLIEQSYWLRRKPETQALRSRG